VKACQNKHSSLLRTFVNYGCKKFYNIGARARPVKLFTNVINIAVENFQSLQCNFARSSTQVCPVACTIKLSTATIVAVW
jgi:hypothetical protein